MSKPKVAARKGHPKNQKLSDALEEDRARLKARKGGISKTATLIAANKSTDVASELSVAENMRPTDSELAQINQYTRSTKTADEVAVFPTLSCNDIVDRDDDQFKTSCVKSFAELEQPFSPTGKSFMLDHEYSTKNQIGRIFDTTTKKIDGAQWLKNKVYVPNTPDNQNYLTNVDFGVHWAVSVGVVLGADECTVCKAPFSSWGWWCQAGHDKGAFYDPNSDETDSWGYPAACDPNTPGAVKCVRQFDQPIDMYELSQVFLGAQYFAALDKDPAFKSVMKSAGANIPVIGLSAEEAAKLPLTHEPEEVSDARVRYAVEAAEDGSMNWTDAHGIRWTFNPEEPGDGIMSLGKVTKTNDNSDEEEEEDAEHSEQSDEGDDDSSDDEGDESFEDDESGNGGSGQGSDQSQANGEQQGGESGEVADKAAHDPITGTHTHFHIHGDGTAHSHSHPHNDSNVHNHSHNSAASADDVIAAAQAVGVSDSVLKAVKKAAPGQKIEVLLRSMQDEHEKALSDLTSKAELGSAYIEELRADAIHWYTISHQEPGKTNQPVQVDSFRKILDNCGDNVELVKALIEDHKSTAQQRFPRPNRRSSFNADPNEVKKPDVPTFAVEDEDGQFDQRIKRIHG